MKPVDPDKVTALIRESAALHIMPRFRNLADGQIRSKEHVHDLQTDADVDMEEALKKHLPALLPGSLVIGEESVSKGDISTDLLRTHPGDLWVVDPVDGTSNFAKGSETFCTMLALVRGGEVVQSWIYKPLTDEMAVAARGEGAYLQGKRMQTLTERPLGERVGFFDLKYFKRQQSPVLLEQRSRFASAHSLFCAGHEYLRIAAGEADFAIYNMLKPWDHLPGVLMVAEAGGVIRKWDGSPYAVTDNSGGLMIAAGYAVWDQTAEMILKNIQNGAEAGPSPK